MLMQHQQHDAQAVGFDHVQAFQVKVNARLFQSAINGIYSDKLAAPIREVCANAWDGHRQAAIPDRPFEVKLPSDLEPVFRVRDYGPSLSHDRMLGIYSTLNDTDKDSTNVVNGGFGLGCKSPFALVSSFSVTTWRQGYRRLYACFIGPDGVPQIGSTQPESSDQPTGLEVSFSVPRPEIAEFRNRAAEVLAAFDPLPIVLNEGFTIAVPEVVASGQPQAPQARSRPWRIAEALAAFPDPARTAPHPPLPLTHQLKGTAMIAYVFSDDTLTLHLQGRPYPVDRTQPNWEAIIAKLKDPAITEAELLALVSVRTYVEGLNIGKVRVGTDAIFYEGKPVHTHLTDRMLAIVKASLPVEPWARFMDNLYQNPSKTAVDELYLWLEASAMPIAEDGHFLAYKKIRDDYTSYHKNADGSDCRNDLHTWVEMPRNQVDDRRDNTCSQGLHFCSWNYLPHYYGTQGRVMIVKINPADVVSIPSDHDNAKGRARRYFVFDEVAEDKARVAFADLPVVWTDPRHQHPFEISALVSRSLH